MASYPTPQYDPRSRFKRTAEFDGEQSLEHESLREPNWRLGFDSQFRACIRSNMEMWKNRQRYFSCYSDIHLTSQREAKDIIQRAMRHWDEDRLEYTGAIQL